MKLGGSFGSRVATVVRLGPVIIIITQRRLS